MTSILLGKKKAFEAKTETMIYQERQKAGGRRQKVILTPCPLSTCDRRE
ncbi:MAG: hypothetical protein F6K17_23190 [Okeania sp. SIO3C4]|nr:hypothetical protein [Okeania sp. SIO3C4]